MDKNVELKISAVLMIYNEEAQIRQCLDTITWVDEIVICDSYSTDKTIEICRKYTDKIYQRKFDDFGHQKKWLLDKPTFEWVLFVEADERFPQELACEIRQRLRQAEGCDGYWIPYKCFVFGREMKGKFWQDKRIKLYRKNKGDWELRMVHSKFLFNGKAGELKNHVLHYPYRNTKVMFMKFNRYTAFEAKELMHSKTRVTWLHTIKALEWVPLRFFKFFFLWHDYKSGLPGLIHALVTSFYDITVNIKYWVLRIRGYGKANTI
jgi:glycosyltransferase involved in cell wall biosynthesis